MRLRVPAEHGDGAVRLDGGQVTGERPSSTTVLDEGGCRLDRVAEVAHRHVAAAGEPAGGAGTGRHRLEVVVEHVGPLVHPQPGRPEGVLGPGLAADLPGLRGPEQVGHDPTGEEVGQLCLGRRREHRPPRSDGHEGGEVVAARRLGQRVEQRAGHGVAHDHEGVHLLGVHEPPDLGRVEDASGDRHDLAAAEEDGERQPVAGGMHERRDGQGREARVEDPVASARRGPRCGCRGRAGRRRPWPRRRCPPVARGRPWASPWCRPCRRSRGRPRSGRGSPVPAGEVASAASYGSAGPGGPESSATSRTTFALRHGLERPGHPLGEAPVVHEADQSRVVVEVAELAGQVAVVDVDRHGADLEAGEHRLDVLGAIDQLQADPVARGPRPAALRWWARRLARPSSSS